MKRRHARDLATVVTSVVLLHETDCRQHRQLLDAQRIGTTLRSLV
jgi:hypothetical protein